MQPWRLMLAGLTASCIGDSDYLDQSLASPYRADNSRRLQDDYTYVCPRVLKHSLNACDRCLSDEMCPIGYECHTSVKKCTKGSWNGTAGWNGSEVLAQCTEDVDNYDTWGAHCLYACDEQVSPFVCSRHCVNEDFPCRWVPNCYTPSDLFAMTSDASACLRGCSDHDSLLQVELRSWGLNIYQTCSAAIQEYGCSNQHKARIKQICPISCVLGECQYRCGRDETPGVGGKQCWDLVMNDQWSCAKAIKLGYDCHCKCGGAYLTNARSFGGAFLPEMEYEDTHLGYNLTVTTNETFEISLTGQAMRIEEVTGIWGPRLKVVPKGGSCKRDALAAGVTGLHCHTEAVTAPGMTATICTIAPSLVTPYLHRWTHITIGHCGEWDVCHCNWKCEIASHWHPVGIIKSVAPQRQAGSIRKAYPGCVAPIAEIVVPVTTDTDQQEDAIIETAITIYAVLKTEYQTNLLHASKQALIAVIKSYSEILQTEAPVDSDVTVSLRERLRRLGEPFLAAADTRRLADCTDDDAAFAEEATKVNMAFASCSALLASGVELNAMCTDASLYLAITRGCQKTCGACGGLTSLAQLPPSLQGTGVTFEFTISVATRGISSVVVARINSLKADPAPFVQRLYLELEDAGVPVAQLPPEMWATIDTAGPTVTLVDNSNTAAQKKSDNKGGSSTIFVILGAAIGGSILIGLLFILVWYLLCRRRSLDPKKGYKTTVETVSEGGYRRKIQSLEVPDEEERELDCCEKLCKRLTCGYCCKTRKEKRAKLKKPQAAWPSPTAANTNLPVRVGCTVLLHSLNKQEFNGLTALVLSGPDERGRYKVDLKVDMAASNVEEHREISLKPDNMRVIQDDGLRETAAQSAAPPKPKVGPTGTYR